MYILPKEHLSVSQVNLWEQDPIAYMKKYFLGIEDAPSPYLDFGKQFAKDIEDYAAGEQRQFNFPPQFLETTKIYPYVEYKLEHDFDTFKFIGFIDNMSADNEIVIDFKTGQKAWTQQRLIDSLQMQVYSLIIWYQKNIIPTCFIKYYETKMKNNQVYFTGNYDTYQHTFNIHDIAKAEIRLKKAAAEISAAYEKYLDKDIKDAFEHYAEIAIQEKELSKKKEDLRTHLQNMMKNQKLVYQIKNKIVSYTTYDTTKYTYSNNILDKEIEIEQLKQIEIESGIAKAETKTVTLINVR